MIKTYNKTKIIELGSWNVNKEYKKTIKISKLYFVEHKKKYRTDIGFVICNFYLPNYIIISEDKKDIFYYIENNYKIKDLENEIEIIIDLNNDKRIDNFREVMTDDKINRGYLNISYSVSYDYKKMLKEYKNNKGIKT